MPSAYLLDRHRHTHTHPFNGPFPRLPGWASTRKVKPIWILLKQQTVSGSGISWAICKSAPRFRQITTPAPHYSSFLQAGCPSCRPTNSVKALKAQWIGTDTTTKSSKPSPSEESVLIKSRRSANLDRWKRTQYTLLLLHPFNGLFSRTTWVSWYQKGKTSLDLNEARDFGILGEVASAGPYANNLHFAPDR